MGYFYSDDELSHHGILGQKWGVRRFENKDGTLTSAGKKRYDEDDSSEEKKKGLTDKQKKALIIGSSVTAGLIAGYAGYRLYELNKFKKSDIGELDLILKNRTYSEDEDMKAVNGKRLFNPFKNLNGQYSHNCALCSISYDLRRRGYDVKAGEETIGRDWEDIGKVYGLNRNEIKNKIKAFDRNKDSYENLKEAVKEYGEGSRGSFHIQYLPFLGGGYHSMVWENVEGEPILRDCQIGKKYKGKQVEDLFSICEADSILRTDNLKVDADEVFSWDWARNSTENDGGVSELKGLMKTTLLSSLAGTGTYAATRKIQKGGINYDKQRESNTNNKTTPTKKGTY